jgi:WD40 repeat protein
MPVGYLLPSDAKPADSSHSLSMNKLRSALEALPCKHLFLVLDCCFSGAFRWSSLEKRDIISIPKKIYQKRFDHYLKDAAWQVLTSSAYDQEALDGAYHAPLGTSRNKARQNHSPFAQYFIEGLQGAADIVPKSRPDGLITASELYLYIRSKLEPETIALSGSHRQTPGFFYLPKHDKGEYVFLSPEVALNLPTYDPKLNPYMGLKAYDIDDTDNFFGRDEVIEELLELVQKQPFTIVTGASGTGKSSLVKAGILPLMRNAGYTLLTMRPGMHPLATLEYLLPGLQLSPDQPTLLLIDQFEELITLCRDEKERKAFLESLHSFIRTSYHNFKLLFTVRSDFEPQFEEGILNEYWPEARFTVPGFSSQELEDIIERPAIQRIILFDPPGLVAQIVKDVQNAPGALPLLSFTMSEMYEQLKERGTFGAFKEEDYRKLGGVIGALRTRADELYHRFDPMHQRTMQKIMLRMVSQEGGELAKRRVLDKELIYVDEEENQRVKTVLHQLTEARLIVRGATMDDQPYVEPAHDALIRAWGTLWGWITAVGKDKLLLFSRLQEAVVEYEKTGSRKDLWQNNTRLDAVNEEKESWLNAQEILFIDESLKVRRRNRNRLIAGLTGVIVALSVALIFAYSQNQLALKNEARAISEAKAAQAAQAEAEKQKGIAVDSARSAQDQRDIAQQQTTIAQQQTTIAIKERNRASEQEQIALVMRDSARNEQQRAQDSAEVAIEQRLIAQRQRDTTLIALEKAQRNFLEAQSLLSLNKNDPTKAMKIAEYLWLRDSARLSIPMLNSFYDDYYALEKGSYASPFYELRAIGQNNSITTAEFLGDTQIIFRDNRKKGWGYFDLKNQSQQFFETLEEEMEDMVFHQDENKLLLLSSRELAVVDLNSPFKVEHQFYVSQFPLISGRLIKDEKSNPQHIITVSKYGQVQTWALDGAEVKQSLTNLGNLIQASISDDGQFIAACSGNKKVVIWASDQEGGSYTIADEIPLRLGIHTLQFFADNAKLLIANGKEIILYDLERKEAHKLLDIRIRKLIHSASLSTLEHYVLAAYTDGTVDIYAVDNKAGYWLTTLKGSGQPVAKLNFDEEKSIVTGISIDGDVRKWDLKGKKIDVLFDTEGTFAEQLWSSKIDPLERYELIIKGNQVLIGDKTTKNTTLLEGHTRSVEDVTCSPDGTIILTTSRDNSSILWDMKGNQIHVFKTPVSISRVAFTEDGSKVVLNPGARSYIIYPISPEVLIAKSHQLNIPDLTIEEKINLNIID